MYLEQIESVLGANKKVYLYAKVNQVKPQDQAKQLWGKQLQALKV